MRRALLVATALLGLLVAGSTLTPVTSPPFAHAVANQSFLANCTTPSEQSFVIPAGVTRILVSITGAQGASTTSDANVRAGGNPANLITFVTVTAGQQYFLDLGC